MNTAQLRLGYTKFLSMVNFSEDLEEGDHDSKDRTILERINASTLWRSWNLHLNDFRFLLKIYPKVSKYIVSIREKPMHAYNVRPKSYSTVGSTGVPYSSRSFKISNAESVDAAVMRDPCEHWDIHY